MNDETNAIQLSEAGPQRSEEMLRALNAAAVAVQRVAHAPDAIFEAVGRELEPLGLYSAVLLLDQDKRQLVVRHVNLGSPTLAAFQKLLGGRVIGYTFPVERGDTFRQVVETGQTILDVDPMSGILDLLPKSLRRPARPIIRAAKFGRSITAPFTIGGEMVGVLSVIARNLNPADIPAITAFADQISAALENAQLDGQLARREREQVAVNAIVQALNASLDVKEVFGVVARELGNLVPFDRASIALLSADQGSFTMHALAPLRQPDAPLGAGVIMPVTATACGPNILAGRLHLTPDLSAETDFVGERLLYEAGLRSRVNVPLMVGDRSIGALNLASTRPAAFPEHYLGLLLQVAGAIAATIQNAQLYEQVQESEARYRHLVENVHDVIYEVDTEGVVVYCSPAIEFLGGYIPDELVGRSFPEFIHPDDLLALLESFGRVKEGVPRSSEFRLRAKDGRYVWARTVSRPVVHDGRVVGLTGVVTDITERKEAELALQRRDDILSAVSFAAERFLAPGGFDASVSVALARLGEATGVSRVYVFQNHTADAPPPGAASGTLLTSMRYEWVAPGVTALIESPDVQGSSWLESGFGRWEELLSHDKTIHGLVRDFPASERANLETQGIVSMVAVPIFVDARWWGFIGFDDCTYERTWSLVEIEALRAAAGTLGAAIQRRRMEEQLRHLKEFNESIVQSIHEGILIEDAAGSITFVNPALEALLGHTAQELIGQHHSITISENQRDKVRQETAKRPRGIAGRYETVMLGRDGQRIPVIVSARPLFEGETFVGVLTAVTDITERKAMEEALHRRTEQLDALLATARHVTSTLDLDEVLQRVIESAIDAIGPAEKGSLHLFDEERGELVVRTSVGFGDELLAAVSLKSGEGFAGWVFAHQRPLIVGNVHADPRFKPVDMPEALEEKSILCMPLIVRDRAIGTLSLDNVTHYDAFTAEHRDLLTLFASQVATAIENARLFQETHQRAETLAALHETALDLATQRALPDLLQAIVARAVDLLGAKGGAIYLYRPETDDLELMLDYRLTPDFTGAVLQRGEGLSGRVLETGQALAVADYSHWRGRSPQFEGADFAATLAVAIFWGDRLLGVLNVLDDAPRTFSSADVALVERFAPLAAAVLEQARLLDEARQRATELGTLYDVMAAATTSVHLDEILNHAVWVLHRALDSDDVAVVLIDEETGGLINRASTGFPETVTKPQPWPIDLGIIGWVARTGEPVLVPDVREDDRYHEYDPATRSELCVPLRVRSRTIGVLNLESHRLGTFTESDLHLVSTLAGNLATVIDNARLVQTLRESEARYRALFEQANDAVFLETLEGRILDANARACDLLGYSREELLALTVADIVPPELRVQIPQVIERQLRDGGIRMEAENVHIDGTRIPVEVSTSALKVNGQELVLALVRDIRERKRLEEQLRQAQKMEAIGTLAGGIAHDFNNLLGGILGFAALMERDLPADSPLRTLVETIIRAARRGAELTNQLLAFARGGRYEVQPTDLNDVAGEVVRLLSRTVDKSIAIELSLAGNEPGEDRLAAVEGDPGQLHQMLLNLCLNAVDAMPAGGQLTIQTENVALSEEEARAEPELEPGPYVRLRVIDTGIGMVEETMQHIFEPFFTTKKGLAGKPHSGLGLSMVYGIVRSHGGAIRVHSTLGQGATFEVYLPAVARPAAVAATRPALTVGGAETVLVVDDEDFIRELLQRALENAGYTVLLAEDGLQALDIYRQEAQDIDLVVLDMGLPRLSGAQTFHRLREIDSRVTVLISSGYAEDDQARKILTAGARGFLAKPYDLDELLIKVRQVLDRDASRRQTSGR